MSAWLAPLAEIHLRPESRFFLGDNIPTLALVALSFTGIGLGCIGFGRILDIAARSRHYQLWGFLGVVIALCGAAVTATGITGLVSLLSKGFR